MFYIIVVLAAIVTRLAERPSRRLVRRAAA
jgi:hypothetical protein